MNSLLNFVFQEQLVPHIFPNGMELSTLDQIVNVLSGTTEHFSGLCCVDYAVCNEAAKVVKRERHFCAGVIQGGVVNYCLLAPTDAVAIGLHRNGTENAVAAQNRIKGFIVSDNLIYIALPDHAVAEEHQQMMIGKGDNILDFLFPAIQQTIGNIC